jgi:hypothetical protein
MSAAFPEKTQSFLFDAERFSEILNNAPVCRNAEPRYCKILDLDPILEGKHYTIVVNTRQYTLASWYTINVFDPECWVQDHPSVYNKPVFVKNPLNSSVLKESPLVREYNGLTLINGLLWMVHPPTRRIFDRFTIARPVLPEFQQSLLEKFLRAMQLCDAHNAPEPPRRFFLF